MNVRAASSMVATLLVGSTMGEEGRAVAQWGGEAGMMGEEKGKPRHGGVLATAW